MTECLPRMFCNYHIVCEFKEDGKEYIMDNSCPFCGDEEGITEIEKYLKNLPQIGYGYYP